MELVIGLVAVVVLVAGLLQIGMLARLHTATMTEAREEADRYALSAAYLLAGSGPRYIRDWRDGPDERSYSRDDKAYDAAYSRIREDIVKHAKPDELAKEVGGNRFTALNADKYPVNSFEYVRGDGNSGPIELLPVTRRLLYAQDPVDVKSTVWQVWTTGIY